MPKISKETQSTIEKMFDSTLYWHTLRVDKHLTLSQMKEFVKEFSSNKWLCGHEYKSNEEKTKHSHIVYSTQLILTDYKINKLVHEHFNVKGTQFGKSQVRTTVHRALCYALKDGSYIQVGFDEKYLAKAKTQSTKKFKKDEFKDALVELETLYYQGTVNFQTFVDEFIDLKIICYGQRINKKSETTYLVTHRIRKDKSELVKYKKDLHQSCENYFLDY